MFKDKLYFWENRTMNCKLFSAVPAFIFMLILTLPAFADYNMDNFDLPGTKDIPSLQEAIQKDSSGRLQKVLNELAVSTDYGKRCRLIDELIFLWSGVQDIDPDSRRYPGAASTPIDARKLTFVEKINGAKYHNKHWEGNQPENPRPGAAKYLLDAYMIMFDYVYNNVGMASFNKELSGKVLLNWKQNKEKGKGRHWEINVKPAVEYILEIYNSNFTQGMIAFQDMEALIKTSPVAAEKIMQAFREYPLEKDHFLTPYFRNFGNNKPLLSCINDSIRGSRGNDYINGFGGDDYIAGLDGDDTLIGGEGNDYLIGGNGNDIYYYPENGWGKDTIDNCHNIAADEYDFISFNSQVKPDDLKISRLNSDLIIDAGENRGQIRLNRYFKPLRGKNCKISGLRFADGEIWNTEKFENRYSYLQYLATQIVISVTYFWML